MSMKRNALRRGGPVLPLMATPNGGSPLSAPPSALCTRRISCGRSARRKRTSRHPPCACRRPHTAYPLVVVGLCHAILQGGPPRFNLWRSATSLPFPALMWILLRRRSSAAVTLLPIARSSGVSTDLPTVRTCCRRGCSGGRCTSRALARGQFPRPRASALLVRCAPPSPSRLLRGRNPPNQVRRRGTPSHVPKPSSA